MIGSTLYLITQYTVTQDENGTFIDYIPTTSEGEGGAKKLNAADIQILPDAKNAQLSGRQRAGYR